MDALGFAQLGILGAIVLVAVLQIIFDRRLNKSSERLQLAERKAFDIGAGNEEKKLSNFNISKETLESELNATKQVFESNQNTLHMNNLFYLYSKQIELYQQQTRNRASWSFIFAIFAMFLGMGFVFWGGSFVLSAEGADYTTAGASISAIGGGISAYIAKTFLDVHKLSLTQLNQYFQQPVINEHILMAQKLTDAIDDEEFRKKSYEKIINSITELIDKKDTN